MLRIKQLREAKGLNMREAARSLNMPYTTYVNYEKGLREPTSEVLIQLANFYETTVDFIVGRAPSDSEYNNAIAELLGMTDATPNDASATKSIDYPGTSNLNTIRIAARNGVYRERHLTDEQISALLAIIDQMPDLQEDL